MVIAIKVAKI